jgi:hypothetical protein
MKIFFDKSIEFAIARQNIDVAPFVEYTLYVWYANGIGSQLWIRIVDSKCL